MFIYNTKRALLLERWILDPEFSICKIIKLPYRFAWFIRRRLRRDAYGHGIGRHSQDEIYHIMDLDLMALSEFLGKLVLFIHTLYYWSPNPDRHLSASNFIDNSYILYISLESIALHRCVMPVFIFMFRLPFLFVNGFIILTSTSQTGPICSSFALIPSCFVNCSIFVNIFYSNIDCRDLLLVLM